MTVVVVSVQSTIGLVLYVLSANEDEKINSSRYNNGGTGA
jgi:surface antigen